jgi:hypothetical protein
LKFSVNVLNDAKNVLAIKMLFVYGLCFLQQEKDRGGGVVMIQVIQPPSSVFTKRCLFHTASVFVVIAVVTITVIVCLSNNVLKTGVKSEIDAQVIDSLQRRRFRLGLL